ncbi:alpha/beta fold hydrolase [uncultured Erythrobacter sp.]|uniref:alpha/beta hydrolase n=1 Tax=uncultured Erythrobacter sp. TaxID=263913 RepID=UPI00262290E3|nr:alpha/beta fold hydrolase [uncultured Erythrobacter sp.]
MMSKLNRRRIIQLGCGGAALAALPSALWASSGIGRFLEYRDISAPGLPAQRLTIWLPPGYSEGTTRYRVLYMHDAQNLFDPALSNFNKVWAADTAMMRHAAESGEDPWIIVGIWSPGVDRYRQYLPLPAYEQVDGTLRAAMDDYARGAIVSHLYLQWITGALKPWLDSALRTKPEPQNTAIIGSSMGGLISLYAFLEYPEVFGRAGCVSTHWPAIAPQSVDATDPDLVAIWTGMLSDKLSEPCGRKLWFDHGTATLDAFYPPYQAAIDTHMSTTSWQRGRDWESRSYEGAEHEENAWAARLPEVLNWVFS